jgi:hypothetical protein
MSESVTSKINQKKKHMLSMSKAQKQFCSFYISHQPCVVMCIHFTYNDTESVRMKRLVRHWQVILFSGQNGRRKEAEKGEKMNPSGRSSVRSCWEIILARWFYRDLPKIRLDATGMDKAQPDNHSVLLTGTKLFPEMCFPVTGPEFYDLNRLLLGRQCLDFSRFWLNSASLSPL